MKKSISRVLFTAALLAAVGQMVLGAPEAPKLSDEFNRQIREAQQMGRDRKVEIEAVKAAFEKLWASAEATPELRATTTINLAEAHIARSQNEPAFALLEGVAADTAVAPETRAKALNTKAEALFKGNFAGAYANYFNDGIEAAALVYREMLAAADFSNNDKLTAYRGLANCQLELGAVAEANATVAAALKLRDLTDDERYAALFNQGEVFFRQLDYAAALKSFDPLWQPELHIHKRRAVERKILDCVAKLQGKEAAIKLMQSRFPEDLERLAQAYSDNDQEQEAIKTYDAIIAAELARERPDNTRLARAVQALMALYAVDRPFPVFKSEIDKRLTKVSPAVVISALARFGGWGFPKVAFLESVARYEWQIERIRMALAADENLKAQSPPPYLELLRACLREGELAKAAALGKELAAGDALTGKERPEVLLLNALLAAGDNANAALRNINNLLKSEPALKSDAATHAATLLKAAQSAMGAGFFQVARALHAERAKLLVATPRPQLACPFVVNGPRTVAEFRDSKWFKEKGARARLERKYGDNLQFLLETDANITGRDVTADDGSSQTTEFIALCDDEGVKLFFFAPNAKARQIEQGFGSLGDFEMYLAAGPAEPYDCFLIGHPPSGTLEIFNTQYDNLNYRRLDSKQRNVAISHRFYDDGVGLLLSVSWAAYFNRLPANGTVWDFEALHWARGGWSWGGSESVHHRSSFGALVFENLTPANLAAIKRRLIPLATANYRNARTPSRNGYMEIWQDPELGDQQFYLDSVKPLETRLNEWLKKVTPEMSDAEVHETFDNAAVEWMNIDYILAAMRRDYLDARRVKGE